MSIPVPPRQPVPESRPSFPQKKAFVLRFAEDAGPETGLFAGRIEHVSSGDQVAFSSVEELFSFVGLVLARAEKTAALPPGTACSHPIGRALSRPA